MNHARKSFDFHQFYGLLLSRNWDLPQNCLLRHSLSLIVFAESLHLQENGRAASPEPRHKTKLTITHLTRNVKEGHIREIFANFGELKGVDLPLDPLLKLPRGFAYVEYVSHEDAVKAQVHMDGGQLDGKILA